MFEQPILVTRGRKEGVLRRRDDDFAKSNIRQISYSRYSKSSGVQMGPLGMSATEWHIVPAPGEYDDGEFGGMKIGRGNRSTRRKPALAPLCSPQIPLDQTRA
jgi:hypothetical protein